MAVNIEVIFTGLALFCLNEGEFCKGKLDTVYLLNGKDDAEVCGRQLDGGHQAQLSFESKHLLPGSTIQHELVPISNGKYQVVAKLDQLDLCLCVEDPAVPGCRAPHPSDQGAVPFPGEVRPGQEQPRLLQEDEQSFEWVPKLLSLHQRAKGARLCREVDQPFDGENALVSARVRLDRGVLYTEPEWNDQWGTTIGKLWRRLTENDYLLWKVRPEAVPGQTHFPKALPGHVMWSIPSIDNGATVLLQDCSREPQKTLFRLRPVDDELKIHVSNAPISKHPLATGAEMEHFRWYYRVVDWGYGDHCTSHNRAPDACPSDLPLPYLPATIQQQKSKHSKKLEPVIVMTDKCPPVNTG